MNEIAITVEVGSGKEPAVPKREQGHDMMVPDCEERCRTVKELREFLAEQEKEKEKRFKETLESSSFQDLMDMMRCGR